MGRLIVLYLSALRPRPGPSLCHCCKAQSFLQMLLLDLCALGSFPQNSSLSCSRLAVISTVPLLPSTFCVFMQLPTKSVSYDRLFLVQRKNIRCDFRKRCCLSSMLLFEHALIKIIGTYFACTMAQRNCR